MILFSFKTYLQQWFKTYKKYLWPEKLPEDVTLWQTQSNLFGPICGAHIHVHEI